MKLFELLEAFNSKVDFDVVEHTASKYQLEATINGRRIKVVFSKIESEADSWDFAFYEKTKSGKWTTGQTGSGGELQVFSFVQTALKEFIDVYHPEKIEFNVFDEDGPKRSKIYQKFIAKMNLPYDLEVGHNKTGGQHTFTLVRQLKESMIMELLNTKFDLDAATIKDNDPDELEIREKIAGRDIAFFARRWGHEWQLEFSEVEKVLGYGTSEERHVYRMTGSGGELKVLSFVIECIKYTISKKSPKKITFTADKRDRARADVYEKMLTRAIKDYKLTRQEEDKKTKFTMTKIGGVEAEKKPTKLPRAKPSLKHSAPSTLQ